VQGVGGWEELEVIGMCSATRTSEVFIVHIMYVRVPEGTDKYIYIISSKAEQRRFRYHRCHSS